MQDENDSFYKLPKRLFLDERYKHLSISAKVLYALLLDRKALSIKNNWIDVNGNGIVDGNGRIGSDVIYWYTSNGTRRWNHWGYVQSASSDHINRS